MNEPSDALLKAIKRYENKIDKDFIDKAYEILEDVTIPGSPSVFLVGTDKVLVGHLRNCPS